MWKCKFYFILQYCFTLLNCIIYLCEKKDKRPVDMWHLEFSHDEIFCSHVRLANNVKMWDSHVKTNMFIFHMWEM